MSIIDSKLSRRHVVSALGAVAAASAIPSMAAQTTSETTAQPLADPRTKYPAPPFKEQPQPWPGLASKMDPKPDRGETSHKFRNALGSQDR